MIRSRPIFKLLVLTLSLITLGSCSPSYVLRAAWEESKILSAREDIQAVLKQEQLEQSTRDKLTLVLEAREFAKEIGLDPKKSFLKYSDVGRNELLWVISASEKLEFKPYTWWFPIVGEIPYKGFFDKQQAEQLTSELAQKGYDTSLRSASAFSTLGWFNDPILSTTLKAKEVELVNTVLHEILHSQIWLKDQAVFNESMANFVGYVAAEAFFKSRYPNQAERNNQARVSRQFALRYSGFIQELIEELGAIYLDSAEASAERKEQLLELRAQAFEAAKTRLSDLTHDKRKDYQLNNAVVIAEHIYFHKLNLFEELFQAKGEQLPAFLSTLREIAEEHRQKKEDPFTILERKLSALKSGK